MPRRAPCAACSGAVQHPPACAQQVVALQAGAVFKAPLWASGQRSSTVQHQQNGLCSLCLSRPSCVACLAGCLSCFPRPPFPCPPGPPAGSWYLDGEEEELPSMLAAAPVVLPTGSADRP